VTSLQFFLIWKAIEGSNYVCNEVWVASYDHSGRREPNNLIKTTTHLDRCHEIWTKT
jgi:hypothetical protein